MKKKKYKWFIHLDEEYADPNNRSWSITTNPKLEGWRTDGGHDGYGLTKELAQWICDILNESEKDAPYGT